MKAGALSSLLCYYTENDVSMKVRGRRYDYVLSEAAGFYRTLSLASSRRVL